MKKTLSIVLTIFLLIQTTPLPVKAETGAEPPPKKQYLAVMDFEAGEGVKKDIGRIVGDKVRETILATKKYIIIDRANIEIIMEELKFGQTAICDQTCAVQVGRALSAHLIITGRVSKLSAESCQVSGQMTDVERTDVVQNASEKCGCGAEETLVAAEAVALALVGIGKPGTVIIQTTPVPASVYVDGDRKGVTPLNIKLRPGSHKIMVAAKKYEMQERVITVVPETTQSLNFSLKKEKKKWYASWWFYTIVGVVAAGGIAAAAAGGASSGGGGGGGGGSSGGGGGGGGGTPTTGSVPVTW